MQAFIEAKRTEIAELCRAHHVRRLFIFGSALRDDFDTVRSDVDVRVEFDRSRISSYSGNYFGFLDGLTALLGRKVDLLSAVQISNPYLRNEIEQTQVMLYAA